MWHGHKNVFIFDTSRLIRFYWICPHTRLIRFTRIFRLSLARIHVIQRDLFCYRLARWYFGRHYTLVLTELWRHWLVQFRFREIPKTPCRAFSRELVEDRFRNSTSSRRRTTDKKLLKRWRFSEIELAKISRSVAGRYFFYYTLKPPWAAFLINYESRGRVARTGIVIVVPNTIKIRIDGGENSYFQTLRCVGFGMQNNNVHRCSWNWKQFSTFYRGYCHWRNRRL